MEGIQIIRGALETIELAYNLTERTAISLEQYAHIKLALLNQIRPYVDDAKHVLGVSQ